MAPCRARPADRSLVAEDRSAEGVGDQTGPEPESDHGLLTGPSDTPRSIAGRLAVGIEAKTKVARPGRREVDTSERRSNDS
jgi:hypothetical protein